MTTYFNFRAECISKYDLEVYDRFMDSFDTIPLACLVNGRFLAVHGGISPDMLTVSDIDTINRFQEPPKEGI